MTHLPLWVPKTLSGSCEQAIFVDLATDASVSSDAVLLKIDRFGQRFQRDGAVQGAVRPVLIVVSRILTQDPAQMVLVPDEGAVQQFAAASCAVPESRVWPDLLLYARRSCSSASPAS